METKSIIKKHSKKNNNSLKKFYHVIYPFYTVTKLWGMSTYTYNNNQRYENTKKCWKHDAIINLLCVTINFASLSYFVYLLRDGKYMPQVNWIVSMGQQISSHVSMIIMECILMYWIKVRDNVVGGINQIIDVDEMVGIF